MDINQNRIVWLEHRLAGTHVTAEPEVIELLNEILKLRPALRGDGAGVVPATQCRDSVLGTGLRSGSRRHRY
jgi:hypothetical protein